MGNVVRNCCSLESNGMEPEPSWDLQNQPQPLMGNEIFPAGPHGLGITQSFKSLRVPNACNPFKSSSGPDPSPCIYLWDYSSHRAAAAGAALAPSSVPDPSFPVPLEPPVPLAAALELTDGLWCWAGLQEQTFSVALIFIGIIYSNCSMCHLEIALGGSCDF